MKLLLFFVSVVALLGLITVAEFSEEGDRLFLVKTHINDRFHVYRDVSSESEAPAVDEANDVDEATQAKLNESFPEEMSAFIDRLRKETAAMRNDLDSNISVPGFDQATVLLTLYEVDVALDETLVLLDTERFTEAELRVAAAVDLYLRAKEEFTAGR